MKLRTFNKGGVHVPECKLTAGSKIVELPAPQEVCVAFSQHIGAPAKCLVAVGDKVVRGQLIAESMGFVSANVHTPITGTVKKISKNRGAFGYMRDTVTIVADEHDMERDRNTEFERKSNEEVAKLTPEDIRNIVSDAGIVGLGGATFPTKVKLLPPEGSRPDVLIINAVECEPYLTNDHALMLEHTDAVIDGIRLLLKATGMHKAIVGIEINKYDAYAEFQQRVEDDADIRIVALQTKYPQGSEKQLIKALTGREVPNGGLPINVGVIVQNVATAYAVFRAVRFGEPLISRIITVTGKDVTKPGNYKVVFGTKLMDVIEAAGGVPESTEKIVLGGPMMGKAIVNLEAHTNKGVSAILMISDRESRRAKENPCIRCGRCVQACPMGLEPYLFMALTENEEWDDLNAYGVRNCIECGCCSYSCPSARPLVDYIRLGKNTVNAMLRKAAEKK